MKISQAVNWILTVVVVGMLLTAGVWVNRWLEESRVLRQVIERLSAESRVAEVLVTKSEYDEASKRIRTTIKFLEYDTEKSPLPAKYFTFQGNVIQFQALVVRFRDDLVMGGDRLRGKSAAVFLKAFVLDDEKTQSFNIADTYEIPRGYKIPGETSEIEKQLWNQFWTLALDPETREAAGVKNAQIEAPGSMFIPGAIYTLHLEHDGGLRIDSRPVPEILKGEKI